jgi:hypothetical protein
LGTIVKVSQDDGQTWKTFVEQVETPTPPPPVPPPPTAQSVDKNGIVYPQPFTAEGVKLSYSNETWDFRHNFRSDGSMRCDFKGVRNSVLLAGYFKVTGGTDNEEIAGKMNGGPHTSNGTSGSTTEPNNTWADAMDMGIVNFIGTRSRIRWEKTHPNYTSGISPSYSQLPIGSIRDKWVGAMSLKVNLPDGRIGLVGMIDVGGLGAEDGKPANSWKITFKRIFSQSEIALKSVLTPYVATIGHPEAAENTIRIDQQKLSEWTSSNPPYKYVTCKQIEAVKI